jgi:CTP synthase
VLHAFGITGAPEPEMARWDDVVDRLFNPEGEVTIGVVGKYVGLQDAYKSLTEALVHGGLANRVKVNIKWIDAETFEHPEAEVAAMLEPMHAILVPGGFGERGSEGKIASVHFARTRDVPFFGICLGMQCAVIEFARDACGLAGANSSEFDPHTPHPVIDLMDAQRNVVDKGGTMRLGAYAAKLLPGSIVQKAYGEEVIYERHRHRYEVNNKYRARLEDAGLVCSGTSPDDRLVEFVELPDHPFFVGTQAHPEFKSRPNRPHPLFAAFVEAARQRAEGRSPRLPIPTEATDRGVPALPR